MHKERLLKLAALLEADAENPKGVKFDLSRWGYQPDLPEDVTPDHVPASCGTTACAIGLACTSGAFKEEGFTGRLYSRADGEGNNIVPAYDGKLAFDAVSLFFELTHGQAHRLFTDGAYAIADRQGAIGERAVARRIREFVGAP